MKKNSSHKTLSIVKRISITNIGIFIIACILSIVATLKLNVEYHIDRDAQMMKVYISNTLSSIDNTLKDMGRVSLIAFSDQMVQDILKGTDYSFDEKMENEEYLTKLYSSMISIHCGAYMATSTSRRSRMRVPFSPLARSAAVSFSPG